jgi:hypothetical protein
MKGNTFPARRIESTFNSGRKTKECNSTKCAVRPSRYLSSLESKLAMTLLFRDIQQSLVNSGFQASSVQHLYPVFTTAIFLYVSAIFNLIKHRKGSLQHEEIDIC